MIIENLKWREVIVQHITSKKEYAGRTDLIPEAYIVMDDSRLDIKEYHSWHSNHKSYLFINPKLIKLTTNELEIEAEWWGVRFTARGKSIDFKNHKVKVTAKF